jgi:hypothetical protein
MASNPSRHALTAIGISAVIGAVVYIYKRHSNGGIGLPLSLLGNEKDSNIAPSTDNEESLSTYEKLIGNTPLIELKKASELFGCKILVKVCVYIAMYVYCYAMILYD